MRGVVASVAKDDGGQRNQRKDEHAAAEENRFEKADHVAELVYSSRAPAAPRVLVAWILSHARNDTVACARSGVV